MGRLFAYTRNPAGTEGRFAPPFFDQRALLAKYAAANGESISAFFKDHIHTAQLPLRDRPQGARLWAKLRTGDTVIAAAGPFAFCDLLDLGRTMEDCRAGGVVFALVAEDGRNTFIRSDDEAGRIVTKLLLNFGGCQQSAASEAHGEAVRAGKAALREAGRQYVSRFKTPYGFKLVTAQDETCFMLPDWQERQLLARILRLRREGLSWGKLTSQLHDAGVRARSGKPLLKQRVHAMYEAALELEEAGGLIGETDPIPGDQIPEPEPSQPDNADIVREWLALMGRTLPRRRL